MKGKPVFFKIFVVWAIVFLVTCSFPTAFALSITTEKDVIDDNEAKPLTTEYFNNCFIFLYGQCNDVSGPALWLFGLYCPLIFEHNFGVRATGEDGERISVIILGEEFGTYFRYENINIQTDSLQ